METLSELNARVNGLVRYTPDATDHWQTPRETLDRGSGDCEDIAILKMSELLAQGWHADDVRLVYCTQRTAGRRQGHMVLEVHQAESVQVLDNLQPEIGEWAQRADLRPLFSFTALRFWYPSAWLGGNTDPQQRLRQWGQCVARATRQGTRLW